MHKLRAWFKSIPVSIVILSGIVVIGFFLRSYQLHSWLDFGSDQVNDAIRVSDVVTGKSPWPLLGPDMSNSGTGGRNSRFHLGPMYYYFEIVSAKIFGNRPDVLAYPDLLFTVLSIPLLYFFSKRFFATEIALFLTGLYAISFYALRFSHNAWNVNSIPFFSLLLLIGLLEFLNAKEKIHWGWILSLAFALGVGVQLHAILLVLFPLLTFLVFAYLLWQDWRLWKKIVVVILLVLVLNAGQIISEIKTGFSNTKTFFVSLNNNAGKGQGTLLTGFVDDLDCHIEANAFILSSVGNDQCDYFFVKIVQGKSLLNIVKGENVPLYVWRMFLALIFSLAGYGAWFFFARQEVDIPKKHFLALTGLYVILSFVVLLPVIDAPFRYFVHVFFIPLYFVGFGIHFLRQKCQQWYWPGIVVVFLLFAVTNINSIQSVVTQLLDQTRSGKDAIILGEIEPMVEYMIAESGSVKEAYLVSDNSHANFLKSLAFIASQKNYILSRASDIEKLTDGKPIFYIYQNWTSDMGELVRQNPFVTYKDFQHLGVYVIQK